MRQGSVLVRWMCVVSVAPMLFACYGTKVPPPQSSPNGPPGLSSGATSSLTIPDNLPAMIVAYRQWLIDLNHHVSPHLAEEYADAEIERITKQYAGHEHALKFDIRQRLETTPGRGEKLKQNPVLRPDAYPTDEAATAKE